MDTRLNLVAIVGPTASGKTAMATVLAKIYDGEIVCADSRTVYKDMDIGTAKPSKAEQRAVAHHCLDLVYPGEEYSAARFKQDANRAISDINNRGKIAFLVGGSGMYADGVLYDYSFSPDSRIPLPSDKLTDLQNLADAMGLNPTEQTRKNPRHLAGLIRRNGMGHKKALPPSALLIGVKTDKTVLDERIDQRVETMFEAGIVDETRELLKKWGINAPGFLTPGYMPVIDHLLNRIDIGEAKRLFKRNDKQLAKRQMTWFKRNKDIHWVEDIASAEQLIKEKIH